VRRRGRQIWGSASSYSASSRIEAYSRPGFTRHVFRFWPMVGRPFLGSPDGDHLFIVCLYSPFLAYTQKPDLRRAVAMRDILLSQFNCKHIIKRMCLFYNPSFDLSKGCRGPCTYVPGQGGGVLGLWEAIFLALISVWTDFEFFKRLICVRRRLAGRFGWPLWITLFIFWYSSWSLFVLYKYLAMGWPSVNSHVGRKLWQIQQPRVLPFGL
jgi:hypothetical protein